MKFGFTLIELSIVLVIIGLVVGGILVGGDLIKGAEIRATIAQIEGYNSAVNTFRNKYGGIPGDFNNTGQFFDIAAWPNMTDGDGNGILEECRALVGAFGTCQPSAPVYLDISSVAPAFVTHSGEFIQFWYHLSASGLIAGIYNGLAYNGSSIYGVIDYSFPRSKMNAGGIGAFSFNGQNYYQLGVTSGANAYYRNAVGLTPGQAFDIDKKIDDGLPNAGSVQAMYGAFINISLGGNALNYSANPTTACQNEATATASSTYAVANQNIACALRFKMN